MWVECLDLAEKLAAIDETDELTARERHHLARCLRCQAEAVRYRRLRRALAELATSRTGDESGVLAGIVASLDAYDVRVARRAAAVGRAAMVLGGVAMATAGATAAVLLSRSRRGHRFGFVG